MSSNYTYELAPKTWDLIRNLRTGTAIFTMPTGPIKCAGAPQKIAYLAADYWRQQGVLNNMRVVLVLPTPGMFGVKVPSDELERVVARYGIEVHKSSELVEVDPGGRQAIIVDHSDTKQSISYDHAGSSPNSKTGAAIRKQAPVVAKNLLAPMAGQDLPASYGGEPHAQGAGLNARRVAGRRSKTVTWPEAA